MMFLFAYLGTFTTPPGWPIQLIHRTEISLLIVLFLCILLAGMLKNGGAGPPWLRDLVALVGGGSASLGLIMPFELAPFFFGSSGEIMLGTIVLNLFYPMVAFVFLMLFRKFLGALPPPLPVPRQ